MATSKYIHYEVGENFSVFTGDASETALFVNITYSDILKIKDELGYSNLEKVFYSLDFMAQEASRASFEKNMQLLGADVPLDFSITPSVGTVLLVPRDKMNRAVASRDGGSRQMAKDPNYKNINDSGAFIADEVESIITSAGYTKSILGSHNKGSVSVRKEMPGVRVMIWCRALKESNTEGLGERVQRRGSSQNLDSHGLMGRWIDITKYVEHIDTNVDDNGGNFTIKLPPIQGIYEQETQSWGIDRSTMMEYPNNIVAKPYMFGTDITGSPEKTEFFFKNAISQNDIVFIAFEPLLSGVEERSKSLGKGDNILRNAFISPQGKQWDMIGLVDSVSESVEHSSNEVSINIHGRDLSKLIIDDGSYMFPLLFNEHNFINKESRLHKRNLFTGSYNFYAEPRYRTVKEAVDWIINVVSNIRIIPENVAKQAAPLGSEGMKEVHIKKANGLDRIRHDREGAGLFMLTKVLEHYGSYFEIMEYGSAGQLIPIWNELESAFRVVISRSKEETVTVKYSDYRSVLAKYTNAPSVAGSSDTFELYRGNKIGAIADGDGSMMELAKAVFDVVMIEDNRSEPREVIESVGGGIWRWVKLVYDDNIMNRKLADVSLGSPDGSLINLIWNYAQSPWIEFFMDTWGDSFYFTFRVPPWTGKIIKDYYQKGWIGNVLVESVDIISEQLDFDTECYSMYQIDYQSATWGTNDQLASVIPTVPFAELAEVWGNKRLLVATNMIPFNDTEDESAALNRSILRDKGIDDLMFAIDINIYKPFTRRGTFVLNGDRRLKKGTWFLYKPTQEIFYITSVAQTYDSSLDRTTTITVERGMVLDYVIGDKTIESEGKQIELSYFNIVDTELIAESMKDQISSVDGGETESVLRGRSLRPVENSLLSGVPKPPKNKEAIFRLNRAVFNFFLQKRQFGKNKVKT